MHELALCAAHYPLTAPPPTPWPRFAPPCTRPWVGLFKPYMPHLRGRGVKRHHFVTVLLHPGDNWMMHVAAEQIQPGDVVVAAVTAECTDGYFGDPAGHQLYGRGARALVIDAGARSRTLTEMAFPVEPRHQQQRHHQGTLGWSTSPWCAQACWCSLVTLWWLTTTVVIVPKALVHKTLQAARARSQRGRQTCQVWPVACWGWTCTRCASCLQKPVCATSTKTTMFKPQTVVSPNPRLAGLVQRPEQTALCAACGTAVDARRRNVWPGAEFGYAPERKYTPW